MKGLTLIEIVVAIVVLAIIITPLMVVFATISRDSATAIFINRANTLASSYMELVLSKSFDEDKNSPWTDPVSLGPDSGEVSIDDFDDVDDYNGYSISDPDYSGFTGTIAVYYVAENVDGSIDWDSVSVSSASYKRIDIEVTHAQMGRLMVTNGVSYAGHTTK